MLVGSRSPSTNFLVDNVLHGSGPPDEGPELLDFQTGLKAGTELRGHFSFSEGRFSLDLRT